MFHIKPYHIIIQKTCWMKPAEKGALAAQFYFKLELIGVKHVHNVYIHGLNLHNLGYNTYIISANERLVK